MALNTTVVHLDNYFWKWSHKLLACTEVLLCMDVHLEHGTALCVTSKLVFCLSSISKILLYLDYTFSFVMHGGLLVVLCETRFS